MRYLTPAETAKLIRKALKANFEGVKFSVRTSGNAVNIRWTEGPTEARVEKVTGPYCGGRFDGMIDMAYNVTSYLLPDGTAYFGKSRGTEGQRGTHQGYSNEIPEGAEEVSFGAKYIFTRRLYTKASVEAAIEQECKDFGTDPETFTLYNESAHFGHPDYDIETRVLRTMANRDFLAEAREAELVEIVHSTKSVKKAARAVYDWCVMKAEAEGQKTEAEVHIREPGKKEWDESWAEGLFHVLWEAGPHEWAVFNTLGYDSSPFGRKGVSGPWGYAEPGFSFSLVFVKEG